MGGPVLDLAVVGGGVAGTYSAYRLATARPEWRVALFERSSRIGGRLLSLPSLQPGGAAAELGGMRFRTSQPLVCRIVAELGLATRPFRTVHEDNRFFLRSRRWRAADRCTPARAYRLAGESGLSPAELLMEALGRIVPEAARLSAEEWLQVKREYRFQGRLLREWTLEEVLAAVLDEEAHQYVLDGFGYATILADRNAAEAIPWVLIEARPESENTTLVDGMEQLPRELAARAGTGVFVKHDVVGIERDVDHLRLSVDGRDDVLARRVLLALPRLPLERLAGRTPLLAEPDVRQLLGTVTAHPAAKLFLAYDRPWWREVGVEGLRSVTDLPLSKTYYFDRVAPDRDGASTSGLMLASYSDGPRREHWVALGGSGSDRVADTLPYRDDARWQAYAATEAQVAEAQRHLAVLHDVPHVPEPRAAAFADWVTAGGAWHVWNAGVDAEHAMRRLAQPSPGAPLYVCGEAFASSQGWVEGALESAERALERILR